MGISVNKAHENRIVPTGVAAYPESGILSSSQFWESCLITILIKVEAGKIREVTVALSVVISYAHLSNSKPYSSH